MRKKQLIKELQDACALLDNFRRADNAISFDPSYADSMKKGLLTQVNKFIAKLDGKIPHQSCDATITLGTHESSEWGWCDCGLGG